MFICKNHFQLLSPTQASIRPDLLHWLQIAHSWSRIQILSKGFPHREHYALEGSLSTSAGFNSSAQFLNVGMSQGPHFSSNCMVFFLAWTYLHLRFKKPSTHDDFQIFISIVDLFTTGYIYITNFFPIIYPLILREISNKTTPKIFLHPDLLLLSN